MPESSIPTVYVHLKPETMEAVMFAKSRKTSSLHTRSKKHQTPQEYYLLMQSGWMRREAKKTKEAKK